MMNAPDQMKPTTAILESGLAMHHVDTVYLAFTSMRLYHHPGSSNRSNGNMADDGQRSSNAELAAAIFAGDAAAEDQLVRRLARPLRLIFRVRRTPAAEVDDLVQETLIILLRRLRDAPLQEPDGVAVFAEGIARQVATGNWRKQTRRADLLSAHGETLRPLPALPPERQLDHAEIVRCVRQCINELRQHRDRVLISEYYLKQVDKPTLCKKLMLSAEHFDRTLYNARTRLKTLLGLCGIGGAQ